MKQEINDGITANFLNNTSLFFCCSTASYSVTCDCYIIISHMTVVLECRVTSVLEYCKSAKGFAAS